MAHGYVALLRGINVGRAKRVAMADLRSLIEALGYRDVRTLLNSGNVVFSASDIAATDTAARIEGALATQLGVSARVTVITAAELTSAVAENPLSDVADDPSRLIVAFLADPSDHSLLEELLKRDWTPRPSPWEHEWPTSGAPKESLRADCSIPSVAFSAMP